MPTDPISGGPACKLRLTERRTRRYPACRFSLCGSLGQQLSPRPGPGALFGLCSSRVLHRVARGRSV